MTSRLTILAAASCLFASCYPYPDKPVQNPNPRPPNPQQQTITSPEQQRIQQQREQARREQAQREQQAPRESQATPPPRRETPPPPPPTPPRRTDYPFASPVHGKDGFVLSPYNNRVVDVRDIPSGTLVQDPTFPDDDTKLFRVP